MDQANHAVQIFKEGYNCAQSVLSAYAAQLKLNREEALKLTAPFGGGIGYLGEVCGAVSGALMAIGLRYGEVDITNSEIKERPYKVARQFMEIFKETNGSLLCRNLIGIDISTPEGLGKAREEGVFSDICPELVRSAAQIVEDLLK